MCLLSSSGPHTKSKSFCQHFEFVNLSNATLQRWNVYVCRHFLTSILYHLNVCVCVCVCVPASFALNSSKFSSTHNIVYVFTARLLYRPKSCTGKVSCFFFFIFSLFSPLAPRLSCSFGIRCSLICPRIFPFLSAFLEQSSSLTTTTTIITLCNYQLRLPFSKRVCVWPCNPHLIIFSLQPAPTNCAHIHSPASSRFFLLAFSKRLFSHAFCSATSFGIFSDRRRILHPISALFLLFILAKNASTVQTSPSSPLT